MLGQNPDYLPFSSRLRSRSRPPSQYLLRNTLFRSGSIYGEKERPARSPVGSEDSSQVLTHSAMTEDGRENLPLSAHSHTIMTRQPRSRSSVTFL